MGDRIAGWNYFRFINWDGVTRVWQGIIIVVFVLSFPFHSKIWIPKLPTYHKNYYILFILITLLYVKGRAVINIWTVVFGFIEANRAFFIKKVRPISAYKIWSFLNIIGAKINKPCSYRNCSHKFLAGKYLYWRNKNLCIVAFLPLSSQKQ